MEEQILFPAEWYPQSGVQLTWPHEASDWASLLDEVVPCFVSIAREISKREPLLIVCKDEESVRSQLGEIDDSRILFRTVNSNDTWARDHGGISVFSGEERIVYDFVFNGWGLKFPSNYDNLITRMLFAEQTFQDDVRCVTMQPIVLEGGSLESDGKGTLMTTAECLLSFNRNDYLNQEQLELHLKEILGVERVLWIYSGYLEGDDTDSHVDTLVRFCNEDTIAYVQCPDQNDVHYNELKEMEAEIKQFTQLNGEPYRLIPLPMADAVIWEDNRLPATYANFLIINGAVLMPTYDSPKDEIAKAALQQAFPDREVVGINCLPLIKQHGSLHCVTMQYPEGFLNLVQ